MKVRVLGGDAENWWSELSLNQQFKIAKAFFVYDNI